MRTIFIDEVTKIMSGDKDVVFLMSECGFSVTESLEREFPDRFFNIGIAEQSLVGTAPAWLFAVYVRLLTIWQCF